MHTIERTVEKDSRVFNELVFKKVHPVFEEAECQRLSKREIEIADLIAQGMSSKQIAAHLHLSLHTINSHRKNMLSKTGCKSSSELVNFIKAHAIG